MGFFLKKKTYLVILYIFSKTIFMEDLIAKLKDYKYNDQFDYLQKTINFILKNKENSVNRNFFEDGHLTGSALLLNPKMDKVLLTHHKHINSWIPLGGHSESEFDIANVALREAIEESGINDITFISKDILNIGIYPIKSRPSRNEPAHLHYDVNFLMIAGHENFIISDESNDLKWFSLDDAGKIDEDLFMLIEKSKKFIKST